jgi:hypothetical protein
MPCRSSMTCASARRGPQPVLGQRGEFLRDLDRATILREQAIPGHHGPSSIVLMLTAGVRVAWGAGA